MRTFIIQTEAKDPETLKSFVEFEVEEGGRSSEPKEDKGQRVDYPKLTVYINDIPFEDITRSYNTIRSETTELKWEVKPSRDFDSKDVCVLIKSESGKILDRFPYKIPASMNEPGQQPLVLDIHPKGGTIGDTITMKVQNPGKDLDKIVVYILKPKQEQEGYVYLDKEKCALFPFYLSEEKITNKTSYHEIKFTLSNYLANRCGFDTEKYNLFEKMFGKDISIKLSINARPSKIEKLTILNESWKGFAVTMGALITLLFLGILAYFSKKINFFPDILLDPETNSFSLANFQSFLWTLVLMGSYFYIAVCQGLILGNPELPEFNFSLIGLLGVSYGGMIAANYVDKRKKHMVIKKDKPELRDLIFDPSGGIDMARMQLFGFNLICLLLYIYYLLKANPLNGLPSIPETLHTLLGTSQAGYIGSQAVTQMITPNPDAEKEKTEEEKPVEEVKKKKK
ncbi:MAG TPA: hypothetical protein PK079_21360 [Leptospiraceae bacterium]|nr:hypothetical protein [Leptospiraceae bacterium]HMX31200.1 hypothetical protein [Leptospiraceae bacterium]HMY29406.1 hypothetical protein [Leptospiraceae bacterium]HMZ66606.1 hypothetical protein [Leptospiraceae bacterium]HNB96637.1 hypothetical protein [Leptospiraceae bacterium]